MTMRGRRLAQSIGSTHSFVVRRGRWQMSTILIIVLLILLLGGGGGYYGYNRYGGAGLGGALGLVLIILLVLWFFGGLRIQGSCSGCVRRALRGFCHNSWQRLVWRGLSAPSELARSAPETAVEQRL